MYLVAFYQRVSTLLQSQDTSEENQLSNYRGRLQSEKWTEAKIYRDRRSARNLDRPGLKELLRDARNKRFHCLAISNISRLSRNIADGLKIYRKLMRWGIRLITLDYMFDSDVHDEAALVQLLTWAQREGEEIQRRIKRARKIKAERGEFLGSVAPYGYIKINSKEIVPANDESTDTVRFIFAEYLKGKSASIIAKILNLKGVRTPTEYQNKKGASIEWGESAVRYILKNRVYVGDLVQYKSETSSYIKYFDEEDRRNGEEEPSSRNQVVKEQQIIRENVCSPLIGPADFGLTPVFWTVSLLI